MTIRSSGTLRSTRVHKYDSSVCLLTLRFRVYEVKEKEGKPKRIAELKRLDGQALFVGHNHSVDRYF